MWKFGFGMAESLSEIFERLLSKQQILVERYRALEEKLNAADEANQKLAEENRKQKVLIEKLETANQYLRIARRIAPDQEAIGKSRELIARLVRDVDKCIEQLRYRNDIFKQLSVWILAGRASCQSSRNIPTDRKTKR